MAWSVAYNKRNYGVTWTGIIESEPLQLVQPQPVTDLEAEPSGLLTWGDESQFLPLDPISYTYISEGSAGGGEDVDTEVVEIIPEAREIARTTTTVRIYNPDEVASIPNPEDRTQWVDVERADTITFEMADSSKIKFIFDWDDA